MKKFTHTLSIDLLVPIKLKRKKKKKRLTSSSFSPIDLLVKVIDKFSMSRTIYQDRDEITKVYF